MGRHMMEGTRMQNGESAANCFLKSSLRRPLFADCIELNVNTTLHLIWTLF